MSENLVRKSFTKQPFHYILIDLSIFVDDKVFLSFLSSLKSVITIATMMKGSERIPAIGMGVITTNCYKSILTISRTNGSYDKLMNALIEIENIYFNIGKVTAQGNHKQLYETAYIIAVHEASTQFNNFIHDSKNASTAMIKHLQLQLTMISFKFEEKCSNYIGRAIGEFEATKLKTVQIVLIGDELPIESVPSSMESTNIEGNGKNLEELIETIVLEPNRQSIDEYFRAWLQDYSTDREHLQLYFPSCQFTVKCDIREHLIDYNCFPFSQSFALNSDPACVKTIVRNQNKLMEKQLSVFKLEMHSLVKISGICDSLVFGFPIIIHPTSCWKLDWNEMEKNQYYFNEIRKNLLDKQMAIIIRMQCDSKKFSSNLINYFAMIPGPKCSMMLKNIATSEFMLPTLGMQMDKSNASPEVVSDVRQSINSLPHFDIFNPMMYTSKLYDYIFESMYKSRNKNTLNSNIFVGVGKKPGNGLN